jgi:hypothetical protein
MRSDASRGTQHFGQVGRDEVMHKWGVPAAGSFSSAPIAADQSDTMWSLYCLSTFGGATGGQQMRIICNLLCLTGSAVRCTYRLRRRKERFATPYAICPRHNGVAPTSNHLDDPT